MVIREPLNMLQEAVIGTLKLKNLLNFDQILVHKLTAVKLISSSLSSLVSLLYAEETSWNF